MMQVDCKLQFIVLLGSLPWNVTFLSSEQYAYLLLVDYQYYTF